MSPSLSNLCSTSQLYIYLQPIHLYLQIVQSLSNLSISFQSLLLLVNSSYRELPPSNQQYLNIYSCSVKVFVLFQPLTLTYTAALPTPTLQPLPLLYTVYWFM